jgi:hypothetical protein
MCAILTPPFISTASSQEDQNFEAAVRKAVDVGELADVYQNLLNQASNETIDRLKMSCNTGIAIRASWEVVRRTMTAALLGTDEPERIDPEAMQHFLGFVEGRLRINPPKWWKCRMARAMYRNSEDWMVLLGPEWIRPMPYSETKSFIAAPRGTSVERENGGLRIVLEQGKVLYVPEAVLKQAEQENNLDRRIGERLRRLDAVVVDKERFLVAFYMDNQETEYPLFCLGCSSGKVLWKANVWAGYSHLAGRPHDFFVHLTDIRIADGVIYVFGLTSLSAYIEGFSLTDGKNKFHFSTSY